MTTRPFSLLSFPVVTVLLAGLTLGLLVLGFYWGLGRATIFLLAIPIALAVVYLAWYRTLPYVPPRPVTGDGSSAEDGEPFEDPVEEADRLDTAKDGTEVPEERDDASPETAPEAPAPP